MSEFSLDMETAFDFVYKSKIFASLNDPETGLRARSPDYIYEFIREEFLNMLEINQMSRTWLKTFNANESLALIQSGNFDNTWWYGILNRVFIAIFVVL